MSVQTQIADKIIRAVVYDVALSAAETNLIAAAPWLGAPVARQILHFTLTKVADLLFTEMDRMAVFQIINLETDQQKNDYLTAVRALHDTVNPSTGSPTVDDIVKAKEEFKKRLSDLVRIRVA